MQTEWREFNDGEEWFAGRALWVWAPSWQRPRLAIAGNGDDFDWLFQDGTKIEGSRIELPTHCCDLVPPAPPAARSLKAL